MTADEVAAHIGQGRERRSGSGWSMPCPVHEDGMPSLSVSEGREGRVLVICRAGCEIEAVLVAANLDWNDLFSERPKRSAKAETAVYDYRDADGTLLSQVVRSSPKSFRQRRPDGAGGWIWNLGDLRRVPYRLPELIAAVEAGRWIVVVEGEKDVDRLVQEGLVATCNPCGAGKFSAAFAPYFDAARVAILPDCDTPGRVHAEKVASILASIAAEVKIVDLPGLAEHGDVSDYLNHGGSPEELKRLIQKAPRWEASAPAPRGASPDDKTKTRSVRLVPAAAVAARPTRWAWKDRIPLGGAVLMVGQEGSGKTTILADIFARASRGQLGGDLHGRPVASVYATAEDSWARTLRPRLEAAGADLNLVHFVEINGLAGGLTIPGDLDALVAEMRSTGALLLALDPLGAHLHDTLDSHRDASVRRALAPLAAYMDGLGATAVGVMHWSKAPTSVALDRVNGSRGFTAAARAVLAVGDDPQDAAAHVLVVAKSNWGRLDVPALRYRIEGRTVPAPEAEAIDTSGVVWLGEAPGVTARDLFAAPVDDDERSDRDAVTEVVREALADGPCLRDDVVKAIRDAGLHISDKSFQRTLRALGVERKRIGFGPGASWKLELPERPMVANADNDTVTRDDVHYVQNEPDQEDHDALRSMVDILDRRRDPGSDYDRPAGDDTGRPVADAYHCVYCGAAVTPAPASVERGWSTVCRSCSESGR